MKIKSIHIENFRNISYFSAEFSDTTIISGRNKVGKSTIRDAILWVLYDRLSDGSAANNIRPKDESGKDIDFIEIKVSIILEHGNFAYEISKIQKQKWVKHRGSDEQRFEGNVNEFEVNGIPKKLKDFQAFVSEIADADTMLFGTNANAFLGMDTKKRRAKLLSLEADFSDADVIALDDDFKEIENDLTVGTIDELITRAKKIRKQKNDDLKTIPVRIDEISKHKVIVDPDLINQAKADIHAQIEAVEQKQVENSKAAKQREEYKDQVLQLKFEQTEAIKSGNSETMAKRESITKKIDEFRSETCKISLKQDRISAEIEADTALLESMNKQGQTLNKKFAEISKTAFDESDGVCHYCGQALLKDKVTAIKEAFDADKQAKLADIRAKAKELKQQIDAAKERVKDRNEQLKEMEAELEKRGKEIENLNAAYQALPQDVQPEQIPEWVKLSNQIKALETEIEKPLPFNEIAIRIEREGLNSRLNELDGDLLALKRNGEIDARIEELKALQKETAQAVADAERQLDILERFNKAKIELLTEKVNQHFQMVKWQMFEPQINGGYAMVCNPTVGGISYFGGLNHGDRLLADMDICKAWQDASGVKLPIFLDDAESVDADRIPEYDRQLIILRRTDDDKLSIK